MVMLPAHHLDLNEPGFIANPYSQLEDLRMDKPVFFDEAWNKIFFTRYAGFVGRKLIQRGR
jgi:unspecific monooxygenase